MINKVVLGVVQVSNWRRHEKREGENQGRVEFIGKILSDHPSIDYTLTDRTVSGISKASILRKMIPEEQSIF